MIGKILGGRYELLEKIGGGGMATVYKARCHLLKRYVAVKILRPELVSDEEFVSKFKKESQAAASLSHQNIVNIYDVGQEDDIHYIVMEYIKGDTLKELIIKNGRLSFEKAIYLAIQICNALEHAHKNHIIHRDIKPQNIIISEDGLVKVADFGIARAVTSATVTMVGANVIGSVYYFSPEQAKGGYTDEKSDLYSLGIVLYEMVTGTLPFEGDSPISIALKHIQEIAKEPREINADIPLNLQNIILKAIEKDPNHRYLTAKQMADDLKRFLKEPNGDYVKRVMDRNSQTQVIPAIIGMETIVGDGTYKPRADKKEKTARYKIMKLAIAVVVLLGFFIILFVIGQSIYNNNFKIAELSVPNIVRKTETDAKQILSEKGLRLEPTEIYNSNIPEGLVISQNPDANSMVKKGDVIKVVISLGPRKILVPKVIEKSYTDAANEIENSGLQVGTITDEISTMPENYVIKQDPQPGQAILPGEVVNLVISKAPVPITKKVPDLIGLKLDDANNLIERFGFQKGEINYTISKDEEGTIIKQDPGANIDVPEESIINLWVSKKKQTTFTKEIIIPLNNIEDQTKVKISLRDSAGIEATVYENIHNKGDTEIKLTLDDHGIKTLIVYINNTKTSEQIINFDAKEANP